KDSSGNWTCPSGTSGLSGFNTAQLPIYALSPSKPNLTYRVLTTRPNYSQKSSGIEVTGTKRMSHNWMMRANLTFTNYTESCSGSNATRNPAGQLAISNASNNCAGGQLAPQSAGSGAFGNDFISAR